MDQDSPDVVIIGAGIIGSSLAWRLGQRDLRVLLIDAGTMGGEASSAGAGMLAPGGEIHEENDFSALLVRSLRIYPSFVAELQDASGVCIDFSVCGAVEKASSEEDASALRTRAALRRRLGVNSEEISPTEFFYPDDAYVNPVDLLSALRVALERSKVSVRERTRIVEIRTKPAHVVVDGIAARAAVIAAGAWSSTIRVESFKLPVAYPVKGHLLGYDLPPGTLTTIQRSGHTYILQRSSGLTIVGASQENAGFDKSINLEVAAEVRRGGEALLPILRGHEPASVWTGLRPASDRPHFERLGDVNVWLAYGHFRNGILSAPATAELLADQIATALGSTSETGSSVRGSSL